MPSKTTKTSLLDDVIAFMRRFIIFSEESHAEVLALWVLHTWAVDASYATPYIYITSAEKQSGKTRVIEVLQLLARHGQMASSITGAAMFRMIAEDRPTIFYDEVDAIFHGASNEDLRGVLNSGYKKNGGVFRFTGKETERFSTFCPKLLAGIDNAAMPDTIQDRCIRIVLKRKKSDEQVERFILRNIEDDAFALCDRIQEWARDNMDRLLDAEPDIVEGISDRAFEISEPLLAIAGTFGRDHTRRAVQAIKSLLGEQTPSLSLQAQVLLAARELMDETHTDRIFSAALADKLSISTKRLGVLLAPYDITPRTIRHAGQQAKGYFRIDFEDAWERYL